MKANMFLRSVLGDYGVYSDLCTWENLLHAEMEQMAERNEDTTEQKQLVSAAYDAALAARPIIYSLPH